MTGTFFDYGIEPNALIEAIRYATFLIGVVVLLAGMVRWLQHVRSWQAWGYITLGLFTSVQELTVVGEPFYPWRLMLLLVMNVCALVTMYRDLTDGYVRG